MAFDSKEWSIDDDALLLMIPPLHPRSGRA